MLPSMDCQKGYFFKGIDNESFVCLLSIKPNKYKKANKLCLYDCTFLQKKKERLCCVFPGSMLEIKNQIDEIFREETATLFQSAKMKNAFRNLNICTSVKNKTSIKNLL